MESKPKPWRKYVWSFVLYLLAGVVTLPLFLNFQPRPTQPGPDKPDIMPTEDATDTGEPKLTLTCDTEKLKAYEGGVFNCQVGVERDKPVEGTMTGEMVVTIGKLPQVGRLPYLNAGSGTLGGTTSNLSDGELKLTMQINRLPASFLLGYPPEKDSEELSVAVSLKNEEYDLQTEVSIPYADKAPAMKDDYEQTKGDFYYEVTASRESLDRGKVFDFELKVASRNTSDDSLNADPFQTVLVTLYPTDVTRFEDRYFGPGPVMGAQIVMVNGEYRTIATKGDLPPAQDPVTRYLFQHASTFKAYGLFGLFDNPDNAGIREYLVSEGVFGARPYTEGEDPDNSDGLKDGKPYWPSYYPYQRVRLVLEDGVGKIGISYDGTKSFDAKSQIISVVPVSFCTTFGARSCEWSEDPLPRRPADDNFLYERWYRDGKVFASIHTYIAIPIE